MENCQENITERLAGAIEGVGIVMHRAKKEWLRIAGGRKVSECPSISNWLEKNKNKKDELTSGIQRLKKKHC